MIDYKSLTKDGVYSPLSPQVATSMMNRCQEMLDSFLKISSLSRSDIEVNDALLLKALIRIDQRSDYFTYFHSDVKPDGQLAIDRMSQYKRIALLCFWLIKYKPLRIKDSAKDKLYYFHNYCTINETFAAYIFVGQINSSKLVSRKQKVYYTSLEYLSDLFYKFMHHDISKEAMIFSLCTAVCSR